jgi:effector-binding domain-containing protein
MAVQEMTFSPKTYLLWRKEIEIKNIMDQTMWQTAYQKVHEYILQHNLTITGPGVAVYFSWDTSSGKGEIGIGNPVSGAEAVTDPDLALVHVPESKAVSLTVHGAYTNFPQNHSALSTYLKDHNKKETLTIEEYLTTGADKPNPDEWETNLYHLYE